MIAAASGAPASNGGTASSVGGAAGASNATGGTLGGSASTSGGTGGATGGSAGATGGTGARGGSAGATGGTGARGGSAGATGGTGALGGSAGATGGTGAASGAGPVVSTWDWVQVVGTGQSLAVGQDGTPAAATSQPYSNLKLSTGTATWPLDPNDPTFALVPLVEPIGRPSTNYPSSYPTNIAGETPHAAMANQITALFQAAGGADYVTVHGEFGENGQCLAYLKKNATQSGVNGRAYDATLIETRAVKRLADAAGKTHGVGAIIVTHGECDAGNTSYVADLYALFSDYAADLAAITGQTRKPLMIVSQQNSVNDRSASTLAQWKIGVDHAEDVVCSGPKYQYRYYSDGVHLVTAGYEALGEKYGQVYFERVVLGHDWRPLEPTGVERTSARVVTVHFHVPVPPLAWETSFSPPHAGSAAWQSGKGFELRSGSGNLTIAEVAIAGDSVTITAAADLPTSGVSVGYALMGETTAMSAPYPGTFRWGLLRDSDPFVGRMTNLAQPNFAVAFELPVP
jgi:hypothetical protein